MNVLRLAVLEGDISAIALNIDLYSREQEFELFKLSCEEGRLDILQFFAETRGFLYEPDLVPYGEFFEDPDGCGYTAYVGLTLAVKNKHMHIVTYLLTHDINLKLKGDFPYALQVSIYKNQFDIFSILLSRGMTDHNERCLRESIRAGDMRFFKRVFPENGVVSDENKLFQSAIAYNNLEVADFLMERFNVVVDIDDPLYSDFFAYRKLIERARVRAANKIGSWWIPICYDPKRDCGIRMMERSWERVERMYENMPCL